MAKLTIVAHIVATENAVDLVKTALEKLIVPTRNEAGCLQYDLHQDNDNPAHFMFYEHWESRDHWLVHMEAPHIAAHKQITEGSIASVALHEMTHIG